MTTITRPVSPPKAPSNIMQHEFHSMEQKKFTLKNTQRKHSMRRRLLNQATYFSILDHTIYTTSSTTTKSEPSSPTGSPRRNSFPKSAPGSPSATSPPPSPVSDPGSYTLTRRAAPIRHIECKRCNEKFDTPTGYKQHVASSENHNVCLVCAQDFPTADHLGVHVRRSHWMCSLCPRLHPERTNLPYFASQSQLEAHFVDEHKEQYCEICSCCFASAEKKKEHIEEAHWACPDCFSGDKEDMPKFEMDSDDEDDDDSDDEDDFMMMEDEDAFFKTREELEDHMFERHGEFYCGFCKEALPSKSAQIKHMANSHPTPSADSASQSAAADQTKSTTTKQQQSSRSAPAVGSTSPKQSASYIPRSPSPLSSYTFSAAAAGSRPRSIAIPANPYANHSSPMPSPTSGAAPRSPLPPLSSPLSRRSSITAIAESNEDASTATPVPSTNGSSLGHRRRASSLHLRNQSVTPPPVSIQPPLKRQRSNTNTLAAAVKCC